MYTVVIWFDGLVFGVFTPLSSIVQLYRGGQFYCWRKPSPFCYVVLLYRGTCK